MPSSHPHAAPSPQSDSPPPAPAALRAAPVLVVGAGPVGVLCAAMLSHRGVQPIVVDRLPDPTSGLTARSYTISLMGRSEYVLEKCKGLLPQIKRMSVESRSLRLDTVSENGKSPKLDIRTRKGEPPFRFIMRTQLMRVLCDYAKTQADPPVQWKTGASVKAATFNPDGSTTLTLTSADGKTESVTARFVIACDGKHSPTLAALREDTSGHVHSSHGFAERSWTGPSSHKAIKSVVMDNARAVVRDMLPKERDWPDNAGYLFASVLNRGARKFTISALPVAPEGTGMAEGAERVSILVSQDSHVCTVNNVEAAFKLFEENFPYLDIREMITPKSMQDFVDTGPGIPFGKVRRPASITATVGDGSGGIVVLGDAAHSFPPDLGQGLNCSVEDVGVLMRTIDDMDKSSTAGDIARAYESAREPDVEGVVFLHRYGARWQFGQPLTLDGMIWVAGLVSRGLLSLIARPVFKLPVIALVMGKEMSYGEAMRQAKATTRRIWVGLAALAFVLARKMCRSSGDE